MFFVKLYVAPFECVVGASEIDLSSPLNYGTPSSRLGGGTPRTPGAAGTPIRPRPDVRSERKMRTVALGSGESVCEQFAYKIAAWQGFGVCVTQFENIHQGLL